MDRFVKLGAAGEPLPEDARAWHAVKDIQLGLWWSIAETEAMPLARALQVAGALHAAGRHDWRLPSVNELFALADRSRFSPAIDIRYFPQCKAGWYWTSTRAAYSPLCGWVVYFADGGATFGDQGNPGHVRAVRTASTDE